MAGLTSIADRLTPSTPIEISYGAQPIAVGSKIATIFGHRAASGGRGADYDVHEMINVGDGDAAEAEVDDLAGEGSELGKMARAFVEANSLAGRSNFPAFRVCLLPKTDAGFGANDIALNIPRTQRTDMIVSCYPASDSVNRQKLIDLATQMSTPDRDLNGQFGTFVTVGSLDASAAALALNVQALPVMVAYLQDTASETVHISGDATGGSAALTNCSTVTGVVPGQAASCAAFPGQNLTVVSVDSSTQITLSVQAAQDATGVLCNVFGAPQQSAQIVAAAHAGALLSLGQPYVPAQGMVIGGLKAPVRRADWIMIDPFGLSEAALKAGLSPLTVKANGSVAFIRTRLSRTLADDGVTVLKNYIDYQQIVKLYDYRESLFQVSQNPPFNGNPGGAMASQDIANKFSDEMLRVAADFEKAGMFQNVKLLSKFLVAKLSTTSPGRLDARVPVDCVPGLYVISTNIMAISDAANFTI